jgi:hypothetical protein
LWVGGATVSAGESEDQTSVRSLKEPRLSVRDDAGAPVGFTIATGRVRGLAFQKIG